MKDWLLKLTLLGAAAGLSAFASGSMLNTQHVQAQQLDICEEIELQSEGEEFCDLEIDKDLESSESTVVGGSVSFQITVTNTGTVPLTNVGVSDEFDEELGFDGSSIEPAFGPDSGLVVWDFIDTEHAGDPDVLNAGESLTFTVEFDALATAEDAENCALAFANVLLKTAGDLGAQGVNGESPDISTDINCAGVEIVDDEDGGGSGGPDPFPTPTDEPELPEPTAAPSAVPTAVPTQPGGDVGPGGIAPPDTGSGPGSGAAAGSQWLLAGLAAAAMILSGAGIVAAKRSR